MAQSKPWSFYGRRSERLQMQQMLERNRWFFLQISGRRRIGKITLIQQALQARFRSWQVEYVAIAPRINADLFQQLERLGVIPQDLIALTADL
ncbi:MAG TPA: hypothetical protein VJA19_00115 [Pseudomonas sp.]|nr:hypothetical protein [Pseudomonas sp.]